MDASAVGGFGQIIRLIEIIFVIVMPFVAWYLGFKMGLRWNEPRYNKRYRNHQKLWY